MGQESCGWTEQTDEEKKEMRQLKKSIMWSGRRRGRIKESLQWEKSI